MPIPKNPTIGSISPTSGIAGTHVTIYGNNFTAYGAASVTFNGMSAAIISQNNTSMVVTAPTSTTGPVVAHNTYGNSGGVTFTYLTLSPPTISSLSPSTGNTGQLVGINGTNFGATQGTSTVTFNGVLAAVVSWSSTNIAAVVPSTATTGPVIVTVGGVASNSSTFTLSTPSNGGVSGPLGLLLIPAQNGGTPNVFTLDPTNFNDPANGSYYYWKVEDGIAGRVMTINRVILSYRDLGVATITVGLNGVSGEKDSNNADTPVANSQQIEIGTVAASQKICTIVLGLALTGCNLQASVTRAPNAGPVSITKLRMEGKIEDTTY